MRYILLAALLLSGCTDKEYTNDQYLVCETQGDSRVINVHPVYKFTEDDNSWTFWDKSGARNGAYRQNPGEYCYPHLGRPNE